MNPRTNPYAPGAGTPPPELAGRDEWIEAAAIALDRKRDGLADKSFIFHGLRGVGKTVLINRIRRDAESRGLAGVPIEVPEGRSLPAAFVPALRTTLVRLRSKSVKLWDKALGVLAGFANAIKATHKDVTVGFDFQPQQGADSGDLEADLAELVLVVGEVAKKRSTAVVFFIDELQYVAEDQLGALIMALHRANQEQLPVTMVAAGLPQLVGKTGQAKSYAERLFRFIAIDRLDDAAARTAIVVPAEKAGVQYEDTAVAEILEQTQCYPYFLQVWGRHCWERADESPIQLADAESATESALVELDGGFFLVRFDRCTPAEKRYLRAMAELGPGPHRSGDIASQLGIKVTSAGPTRSNLIKKGMIYSPAHGDTAFTVPLFDGFLKRVLPIS